MMLPKTKRQQQSLEKARKVKRRETKMATRMITDNESELSGLTHVLAMSNDVLDTKDEEKDPNL